MSSDFSSKAGDVMGLFFPEYLQRCQAIIDRNGRFVHYTNAETAMKIFRDEEVWLRNTRSMNDFSEVEHGFDCFRDAFNNSDAGKSLRDYLEEKFPGIIKRFAEQIDGWLPSLRNQTYILSVSEHDNAEDENGRLSMWRAYGKKHSVALVFKNHPFLTDCDAFKAYAYPVEYQNSNYIEMRFSELESRLRANPVLVDQLGENEVQGWLFHISKVMILCIKHPGFKEEREWRVVYSPELESSEHVRASIECLRGVPQQVFKISLKNIPEKNFTNGTIPEIVDRLIIGPSDEAPILIDAFCKLLEEAGCSNSRELVHFSGIPLRSES